MTTTRSLQDELVNALSYLAESELALYYSPVSVSGTKVSFHSLNPLAPFLSERRHHTVKQYADWVTAGAYSALLLDGSLLQLTYEVSNRKIVSHRLAYVPCPYSLDPELLASGESLSDILDLYLDGHPILRSPVRFDFDPQAAKPGHPAVHFTINDSDCRIACAAPFHPLKFLDFVFRNFYPEYWQAHKSFFLQGAHRDIDHDTNIDFDRRAPHFSWN